MAAVILCLLLSLTATLAVRRQANLEVPAFSAGKLVANVHEPQLTDASGLAASQKFKDVIYTHNDGAGGPYIYAINATTGEVISTMDIAMATNHDWEDIAVGPCGENSCIYIADSGYRSGSSANTIYRVQEPDTLSPSLTLAIDSTATYTWSEDESQTLMVDPNGEVYLIGVIYSGRGMVSHLPASAWGSSTPANIETTQFLPIHTHHHDPVSGDISRDGTELLIKSKSNIFYWKIENGDVLTSFTKPPVEVPYHPTGLGEAICWSADGQSYYTLPEGHHPALYVYSRLGGGHGSSSVIGK